MKYYLLLLEDNLRLITEVIEQPWHDIDELTGKMNKLACLSGLASETQGLAKAFYLQRLAMELENISEKVSPTIRKMRAEGAACNEAYIYEWAERLNSKITTCIEVARTTISKYKAELEASRYQQ